MRLRQLRPFPVEDIVEGSAERATWQSSGGGLFAGPLEFQRSVGDEQLNPLNLLLGQYSYYTHDNCEASDAQLRLPVDLTLIHLTFCSAGKSTRSKGPSRSMWSP